MECFEDVLCWAVQKKLSRGSQPLYVLTDISSIPPNRPHPHATTPCTKPSNHHFSFVSQGILSVSRSRHRFQIRLQPYGYRAKSLRNRSQNRTAKLTREAKSISRAFPVPFCTRVGKAMRLIPFMETRGTLMGGMFRCETDKVTSEERFILRKIPWKWRLGVEPKLTATED